MLESCCVLYCVFIQTFQLNIKVSVDRSSIFWLNIYLLWEG